MPGVIPVSAAQRSAGEGWTDTLLADAATSGEPMPIAVRRIELRAGATSEVQAVGTHEGFVYVVEGSGFALAEGEHFELAPESVLWLDAGDPALTLTAGTDGLTVLFTRAD